MKSKKGYFFIIDAMMALFVLVLGTIIILSSFMYEPSEKQASFIAFDLMDFLSSNKIQDINNQYVGPGGKFYLDENITNLDNSLIQQVCEFYYRNVTLNSTTSLSLIAPFVSNVTSGVFPSTYGFILNIDNHPVYNYTGPFAESMANSSIIIPSKKIVYGNYVNSTHILLYGPYEVEVIVWA
jgi:hypothetical protein